MADLDISDNTPAGDDERRKALLQGIALPNPFSQAGLPGVTPATVTNPTKAAAIYAAPPVTASQTGQPAQTTPTPMAGLPPVSTPEDQRLSSAQKKLSDLQAKPSLEQRTTDWGNQHGVLGKIGGGLLRGVETAGEVLMPNVAAAIPGTQVNLNRQRQAASGEVAQAEKGAQEQAQTAHTKAETAKTQAETENIGAPKEGLTPEETTIHDLMTGNNGLARTNPETGKPYTYLEAYQAMKQAGQDVKPDKSMTPEQSAYKSLIDKGTDPMEAYKQVIEAKGENKPENEKSKDINDYMEAHGLQDTAANREKARDAIAGRVKPQQVLAVGPDNKAFEVRPGTTIPQGTRTVSGDLAANKPTADETRRADLARNMEENLTQLEDIVTRRPDLFGPAAGRLSAVRGFVGTSDPDIATLKTVKEQLGMAMVGAHAMRNAQHVEAAANAIVNGMVNKPEAIQASIAAARKSLGTFLQDEQRAKGTTQEPARPSNVPAGYIYRENGPKGTGWYKP